MFYCPSCERRKDTFCFPKFMSGLFGKICKSCLAKWQDAPITHWWQRKFNNAGFQKESAKQIEDRRKMIALDNQYIYK
jgi:hypothetical protein